MIFRSIRVKRQIKLAMKDLGLKEKHLKIFYYAAYYQQNMILIKLNIK